MKWVAGIAQASRAAARGARVLQRNGLSVEKLFAAYVGNGMEVFCTFFLYKKHGKECVHKASDKKCQSAAEANKTKQP